MKLRSILTVIFLGRLLIATAGDLTVAPAGGDYALIQDALNAAVAGDTVTVRAGVYNETLTFPRSGNTANGWIHLRAIPGESVILDGTNRPGGNMMYLENRAYIRITGFEIRHNTNVNDGSGIRVYGASHHITLESNVIHHMLGLHAMGITVYGVGATVTSNIVISANRIYSCEPAESETLTLNGNIRGFEVISNTVYDVNNIGIDFIGGESEISTACVCRQGVCRGNHVYRARSTYGGGYGAGIYVDSAQDIVLEHNIVHECDLGIEIGAENTGYDATGIVVRSNLIFHNDKAGLVFGGYDSGVGRTKGCRFQNNTLFQNDTLADGNGEIWIQYASSNLLENNVIYGGPQNLMIGSFAGNVGNRLDYNVWYSTSGSNDIAFQWNGTEYGSFSAYRSGTGQDTHSLFQDPRFVDPTTTNFHVAPTSVVINAGSPGHAYSLDEKDLDGESRVMGDRVDAGADETSGYWSWRNVWFGDLPDYTNNPESPVYSPFGDYDADGCGNLAEFLGNTDPRQPTSYLAVTRWSLSDPAMAVLEFPVRTNRTYRALEASPSMIWTAIPPLFLVHSNRLAYPLPVTLESVRSFYALGIGE